MDLNIVIILSQKKIDLYHSLDLINLKCERTYNDLNCLFIVRKSFNVEFV